jgi:Tol biopolymer transport system component
MTLLLAAAAAPHDVRLSAQSRPVAAGSSTQELLAFVTVRYVKVRGAYAERGTIWTADLDASNRRQLARGNYPDISPDGRWVAFLDWANRLRIVPTGGGSARVIARGPLGAGFTWAPHSRQLAVIVGGSLLAIDIGTGRRVRIDRDVRIWGVSFSPSGKKIVWARKTGKHRVTLGDVDLFSGSTNGGDHWRLTSDRGSDRPVWGRAGIAFARFEPFTLLHPPVELWFVRPDGTGERLISGQNLAPLRGRTTGADC